MVERFTYSHLLDTLQEVGRVPGVDIYHAELRQIAELIANTAISSSRLRKYMEPKRTVQIESKVDGR